MRRRGAAVAGPRSSRLSMSSRKVPYGLTFDQNKAAVGLGRSSSETLHADEVVDVLSEVLEQFGRACPRPTAEGLLRRLPSGSPFPLAAAPAPPRRRLA